MKIISKNVVFTYIVNTPRGLVFYDLTRYNRTRIKSSVLKKFTRSFILFFSGFQKEVVCMGVTLMERGLSEYFQYTETRLIKCVT